MAWLGVGTYGIIRGWVFSCSREVVLFFFLLQSALIIVFCPLYWRVLAYYSWRSLKKSQ